MPWSYELTNNSQKPGDEILRLIEADHDDTTQFIARLIGLQSTTRTIAVTLVSALAGFALANHSPIMALAGVPIVLLAVGSEVRSSFSCCDSRTSAQLCSNEQSRHT